MSTFCNYAVLRFQPYPQTGEFANLGIVMLCSNGDFEFLIESKHFTRITHFFGQMDKAIFLRSRKKFADELQRIATMMEELRWQPKIQQEVFKHLIGPSATMFRFSEPRIIASKCPKKTINELFETYVLHKFDTKIDEEVELTKTVGRWLKNIEGRKYTEVSIGDDLQPIKFPYALHNQNSILQAIKPISFDLQDAGKILDKGNTWFGRLRRLEIHKDAPLETILVSRPPSEKESPMYRAYKEVIAGLTNSFGGEMKANIMPITLGRKEIINALTKDFR